VGIFERRDEAEEEEIELEEGQGLVQTSPQGWVDGSTDWPTDTQGRYAYLFESPMAAAKQLDEAGKALVHAGLAGPPADGAARTERFRRLEAYTLALQALKLPAPDMLNRRGSYGTMTHVVREHMASIPAVLHYRTVKPLLEEVLAELEVTGDPQLEGEGSQLRTAMEAAEGSVPEAPSWLAPAVVQATPARPAAAVDTSRPEPPEEPEPPAQAEAAPEGAPPEEASEEAGGEAPAEGGSEERAIGTPGHGGPDLTAEKIFRVLLEECLKDGKLSQAETRAIQQIRQVLTLPIARHRLLAEAVQADYEAGRLKGSEDMAPLTFFEKICRIALQDGVVTGQEQQLLQAMATYLHITKEEFAQIRARIEAKPGLL
jgi:tellurite resistance protein